MSGASSAAPPERSRRKRIVEAAKMDDLEFRKSLAKKSDKRIVLFVIDGLGGLAGPDGATELQAARTPNLDALAARSACGLHDPVSPGITPGLTTYP